LEPTKGSKRIVELQNAISSALQSTVLKVDGVLHKAAEK